MRQFGVRLEIVLIAVLGSVLLLIGVSLFAEDIFPIQSMFRDLLSEDTNKNLNIKSLTTGRTNIWVYVFENSTPFTTFFGNGFGLIDSEQQTHKMNLGGTQNSFLMTFAMSGVIGFIILSLYYFQCLLLIIKTKNHISPAQSAFYIMVVIYFSIDSLITTSLGTSVTLNNAFFLIVFSLPVTLKNPPQEVPLSDISDS